MTTLQRKDTATEFIQFNYNRLKNEYFQHYHLSEELSKVITGQIEIRDGYNIIGSDGTDIMVAWIGPIYFVYAKKWNNKSIQILSQNVNQIRNEIKLIRGQKNLIDDLIKSVHLDHDIINIRYIYEYKKSTEEIINESNHTISIANKSDYSIVLKMCLAYYIEDFDGKGQQTLDQQTQSVQNGIRDSSIYILKVKDRIVSLARIINTKTDNVMIGGLYTNFEERKKGYAYNLISNMTNLILSKGFQKCGLLTESTNIASNKVFEKVGYKKVYEWSNILLK